MENNIQLTGSNVDYILEGVNRYLLELAKEQIRLAFEQSEKEVQDLHQRTREGIETARLNGKQIGRQKNSIVVTRKSIESKEVIRKLSKEFDGNLSDAEIMRLTGLARNTYYKYKRELKGSMGHEPIELWFSFAWPRDGCLPVRRRTLDLCSYISAQNNSSRF